jgi:hypothetical protein
LSDTFAETEARVEAAMTADFPGHSWEALRPLYKLWSMRLSHRAVCTTCHAMMFAETPECEIGAVYTQHLNSALGILSKRRSLTV